MAEVGHGHYRTMRFKKDSQKVFQDGLVPPQRVEEPLVGEQE